MAISKRKEGGGLKGFLSRASKSFLTGGLYAKDKSYWAAEKLCKFGFIVATTSLVVLMPLVFEIAREGQVCTFILLEYFLNKSIYCFKVAYPSFFLLRLLFR